MEDVYPCASQIILKWASTYLFEIFILNTRYEHCNELQDSYNNETINMESAYVQEDEINY